MNRIRLTAVVLVIIAVLALIPSGCTGERDKQTSQIFALDTVIDLTAYGENAEEGISSAKNEIYRLEKLLSVTDENSEIYKLNNSEGNTCEVSDEVYGLIEKALELNDFTDGKFDISLYTVLRTWGFTEDNHSVPTDEALKEALSFTGNKNITLEGNNRITLKKGTQVDLGGIAKGYISDKAADAMSDAGVTSGIISIGGNVRTIGTKASGEAFTIGIRYPDSNTYFATVLSSDNSVITSGAYQRNFTCDGVTYHHIIDPDTGYPSDSDALSVTVIGDNGAVCDGLSTALFVGGSEYAQMLYSTEEDFEYIILTKDNHIYASNGLEGKLSLHPDYSNLKISYAG